MNTAVAKTSKTVKTMTSTIRAHFDVMERAREIYLSGIKRLEAEYYERIKRATETLTGEHPNAETSSASVPPAEQAADNPASVA